MDTLCQDMPATGGESLDLQQARAGEYRRRARDEGNGLPASAFRELRGRRHPQPAPAHRHGAAQERAGRLPRKRCPPGRALRHLPQSAQGSPEILGIIFAPSSIGPGRYRWISVCRWLEQVDFGLALSLHSPTWPFVIIVIIAFIVRVSRIV